jgi:bifunctional DNA-binding transcriptional regulator/antitoxin component of YhaV-PrlF toxin-antitoxin module
VASVFVSIQGRGTIALPADVRRRLRLDEPGAQVEVIVRDDDVIELHPCLPVASSQAWFWSREWQEREREVDEALAAGESSTHESVEGLLEHLDGDEA